MHTLNGLGVKFIVCDLCLQEQLPELVKTPQYKLSTLLGFVKPVPFSIDYIASNNSVVIYD